MKADAVPANTRRVLKRHGALASRFHRQKWQKPASCSNASFWTSQVCFREHFYHFYMLSCPGHSPLLSFLSPSCALIAPQVTGPHTQPPGPASLPSPLHFVQIFSGHHSWFPLLCPPSCAVGTLSLGQSVPTETLLLFKRGWDGSTANVTLLTS